MCALDVIHGEETEVDFTVLKVGDHVQFYEPHRTFGDTTAFHTAQILSIGDGDNPLVLSSTFMLSRHNFVRKVVLGVPVNGDLDSPSKTEPHWRKVEQYTLICGGAHGHAAPYERAAKNAKTNARRLIKKTIRKVSKSDGVCLRDVFNYNK